MTEVPGGLWQKDIDINKWDYVYNVFGIYLAKMSTEYMFYTGNIVTLLRMTSVYLCLSKMSEKFLRYKIILWQNFYKRNV